MNIIRVDGDCERCGRKFCRMAYNLDANIAFLVEAIAAIKRGEKRICSECELKSYMISKSHESQQAG